MSNAATRAEPKGIGTAGARDQLAREVTLLGALLGQVIAEQEGEDGLDLVERVRKAAIARKRHAATDGADHLVDQLDAVDLHQAEVLVRAFSLYFQLTNLCEEKQRIRRLRQVQRGSSRGTVDESIAAALDALGRAGMNRADVHQLVGRMSIAPVLTAHPTEARRRTLLVALRRVYRLLDQLDDPRLTQTEDGELRRRLREEISILWHTPPIRHAAPTPLDEVRTAMAFFDESLFVTAPRVYRQMQRAMGEPARAFLSWGSWIGGDRDGNPTVTSETTRETMRIQSEHVLRGYEAVARRLSQTLAAEANSADGLAGRLRTDAREMPELAMQLEARFGDEPFRRRFAYMAERLRRTRLGTAGGYAGPTDLATELAEAAEALSAERLGRAASGEVQDLRWQVDTFGFHGLALEVRQHSEVHSAALQATADSTQVVPGVSAGEVFETFRAVADIQGQYGVEACNRYVVSFTRSVDDLTAVLELAATAIGEGVLELDVIPLFESADALANSDGILRSMVADDRYRAHLKSRGMRQEVMLGYSDSTKESGSLAAAWMLYRAQEQLGAVAQELGIGLTLFHGRGGAIGRGGGPMTRAILAQAPGSVNGRLKLTEQGEVIADRYANPQIALRHLEQLTYATLVASVAKWSVSDVPDAGAVLDELAVAAQVHYRQLVADDADFQSFFVAATPIAELAGLGIGSRPTSRGGGDARAASLTSLRAIPWVFAWSQSRVNLPGWFGTGAALAGYRATHGTSGLTRLRDLYASWPFFASVLDNSEMILAKADMSIGERYSSLASPDVAGRIWPRIREEFDRTLEQILAITQRQRLLDNSPVLQRAIALRNPYIDSLSELQVRLLRELRGAQASDPRHEQLQRLVHLTVSGIAAGLQNTG